MSEAPQRIQLSRKKGWRMPSNTMKVARPSKWGNPITVRGFYEAGYSGSVDVARQHCVDGFRAWMGGVRHWSHGIPMPYPPDISDLRGKNLACFCPLGSPCHADVLLELANRPIKCDAA